MKRMIFFLGVPLMILLAFTLPDVLLKVRQQPNNFKKLPKR